MTQKEYEQKKRECWEEYCQQYGHTYGRIAFDFAFDRAYALGKQEKDADEEPKPAEPTETFADKCKSQCKSQNFDNIVNRGFRDHNRLHIAAQIVAALYANYQAAKNFKSIEELVRKALDITDTLIKESEKGDSK